MKTKQIIIEGALADFKKSEEDLLKKALTTTYTERFNTMTRLMKMNFILKSAKVFHKKMD